MRLLRHGQLLVIMTMLLLLRGCSFRRAGVGEVRRLLTMVSRPPQVTSTVFNEDPSAPSISTFPKSTEQQASEDISVIEQRLQSLPPSRMPKYDRFRFDVDCEDKTSRARCGTLCTPRGDVQTPNFIFCGTKATVKGVTPEMLRQEKTQIILSNTYHLLVQPGPRTVEKLGGVQTMSGWRGPMLTDSGGYQIFSMGFGSVSQEVKGSRGTMGRTPSLESITEQGARFKNYRDGTWCCLTPESSIAAQRCIGADLIVVLDECTPFHVSKDYTEQSMHRSHRWALRSLEEFIRGDDGSQALYGIVQGGVYPDLRKEAAEFVNSWPFFGHAIGGSLGDSKTTMYEVVSQTATMLRRDRPIHLLGIGSVKDIFTGVRLGVDTFDCVHPTRIARHGGALVKASHWEEEAALDSDTVPREHTNLLRARYKDDPRPIDSTCECYTCRNFSRGYIRHLLKAGESLAGTLLTIHNVHYMNQLMTDVRKAIREGTLDEERKRWLHPKTVSTF